MANFANPTVGSNYTDFPDEIRASVNAALQQLSTELIPSGQSNTNIPNGAIKWDHQNNKWVKKVNGSFNSHLSDTYNFTQIEATGLNMGDCSNLAGGTNAIKLGASDDLRIFHDGNHSYIRDFLGAGNLKITTNQLDILNNGNTEFMAKFIENGSVELYENNTKRFETSTTGATVTGALTTTGSMFAQGGALSLTNAGGTNAIEVGAGQTGNHFAFVDLIGDTTYSDYGLRIVRGFANDQGPNTISQILHRGTGQFQIKAQDAGKIALGTSNNTRLFINQNGQVSIGSTSPQKLFDIHSAGTPEMIIRTSAASSQDAILRLRGSRTNGLTDINQFIFETNDTGSGNYAAGSRLGSIICGKQASNTTRGFFDFRLNNNTITDGSLGTNTSSKLYIKPSNEIGIGTTNPQRLLELSSADQTSIIRLHSSDTTIANTERIGMIEFSGSDAGASGIAAFIEAIATNSSGQAALRFATGTAGSAAEKMRLDAGGRLIFGRTTQFNSRVGTNSVQPLIQVHHEEDGSMSLTRYVNSSGHGGRLFIQKARGTVATPLVVVDGDNTGEIRFSGYDGTNFANGCTILNRVNGTVSSNTLPSDLEFYIRDASGNSQELLTLNHDRFVGINKANPEVALNVKQLTDNAGGLRVEDSGSSTRYMDIDVTDGLTKFSARNNTANGTFTFVGTNNSTELEYLRILNGGGVSIGSTTMQTSGTTADRLSVTGGNISTNSSIVAGRGSGSIGLTPNDGYGNANLTFNHVNGKPDNNGNAARIEVNTDSNTGAVMLFELKSGVTQGTAVNLTSVLDLLENQIKPRKNIIAHSDSSVDIGSNSVRFANGYFDTLYGDGSNLTSLPAAQLTGTVADARITTLTASKLTGALPAIDGSNLTGISQAVRRIKQVSLSTEAEFNGTDYQNHLSVTFDNVPSDSRFVVFTSFEIKSESTQGGTAQARIAVTNGNILVQKVVGNGDTDYDDGQFSFIEFDASSNTNDRTYTLQVRSTSSSSSRGARIRNASIIVLEFGVS